MPYLLDLVLLLCSLLYFGDLVLLQHSDFVDQINFGNENLPKKAFAQIALVYRFGSFAFFN